jgi:bacterioferritin B
MLIGKEMAQAINTQIGYEFEASNQYLAIACYFEQQTLPKLAQLFFKQAAEEREHGMKFVKYVNEAGGAVAIPAIPAPKPDFPSVEEAIKLALQWEYDTTDRINKLMSLAIDLKDYLAQDFLRWFVTEQLEEVSSMDTLLRLAQKVGERNLIMLEAYLAHKE